VHGRRGVIDGQHGATDDGVAGGAAVQRFDDFLRRIRAETRERLEAIVRILHADLMKRFGIAKPRILVAGLNPHAGESGYLGREEIDVIGPVIAQLSADGLDVRGPYPADTLYTLSGYVKVQNGATLTIQAGTRIIGDTLTAGSSLWILRGAKIQANGTAAEPIVFTSGRLPGNRKPGDWGGIIIIGNGVINRTGDLKLQVGDVVTVEPGVYREGFGGIRVEDLVVVTENGCRVLTASPKDSPCPPSPPTT